MGDIALTGEDVKAARRRYRRHRASNTELVTVTPYMYVDAVNPPNINSADYQIPRQRSRYTPDKHCTVLHKCMNIFLTNAVVRLLCEMKLFSK